MNGRKNKIAYSKVFRVLRSIGLALLALSGSVIAAPGFANSCCGSADICGCGVLSAVSQMTVDDDAKSEEDLLNRMRKDNENLPRDGIK
jgi:hypothetical protein